MVVIGVILILAVGLDAWRRDEQDYLLQGISVGLIAGLVGMLVHGIGANTFIIVRIMEPFWFVVGIVIALASINEENSYEPAF